MSRDDFIAWLATAVAALAITVPAVAPAQNLTCGLKPIPEIGCRIGRCVNGAWEQICDRNPGLSCGIKPIAETRLSGRSMCRRGLGTDLRSESGAVLRPQADSGDRLPDRAVRGWGVGAGV